MLFRSPGGHTPAGQHSPLSFYLRDSAGRPALHLRYPFPGFSRAASIPGPHAGATRSAAFPGISFACIQLWYYLNTGTAGCQSCISTKCPYTRDVYFLLADSTSPGRGAPPAFRLRTCVHGLGFSPADKKSSLAALTARKGTRRGKAGEGPLGQRSAAAHAGFYNSRTETTPAVALISSWRCSTSSPL